MNTNLIFTKPFNSKYRLLDLNIKNSNRFLSKSLLLKRDYINLIRFKEARYGTACYICLLSKFFFSLLVVEGGPRFVSLAFNSITVLEDSLLLKVSIVL